MRDNVDGNAYHAAYKSYSTLDGASYHHFPTLPAQVQQAQPQHGILKSNGSFRELKMRQNGQGMAGVVASYGVYHQQEEPDENEDDHGFANANFRGNGGAVGSGGGGGRGMVVNASGGAAVVVDQRHCPANAPATTTNPEGWMTCCRPIVLLLTLVLLIIVFVFVSGVLLYINYVAYKPRQSYVEEPCEKTFCAWGAQCVTGADGSARCQCPTHCRSHAEQPVCGGDGRTYESHCHLRMAACRARLNVRVLHDGKCGINDPCKDKNCPFGARCIPTSDGKNATCQCPTKCPNYGDHAGSRPVCGSDGQDYDNQCELRRTGCQAGINITVKFPGKCDPCEGVACSPPAICQLDERRHPACRCDENCPRSFDPVCGTDGKTYANECSLRQESCRQNKIIGVVYRGKCSSGINPCGSIKCTLGESCVIDKFGIARCECPTNCPPVVKPVCSIDGKTYASECEMLKEGCLARVKLEVDYVGVCGDRNPCHAGGGGCRHGAVCVVRGEDTHCECPKCSEVFEPVCGHDGVTYVNECMLKRESCLSKTDLTINYVGICDACLEKQCDFYSVCQSTLSAEGSERVKDGIGSEGLKRIENSANCICPEFCDAFEDLKLQGNETVCGSNGVTYVNECLLRIAACGAEQNIMVAYKGDCDLCSGVECKHGGRCAAGECVCPTRCDAAGEEPVCASNLTTFRNECELQKAACQQTSVSGPTSQESNIGSSPRNSKLTVLFYGDCRERFPVPGITTESNILPNGETGQTFEGSSGTDISIIPDQTSNPTDGCKDIQCDFDATCELGADNFPRCTCQFNCTVVSEQDSKPVCASNMRIYPSICAMKMEACQSQSELRLRPLDLCQGMEVKPCNGDKPIVDPLTDKELDCGNGPQRQDCPSGSYCHQTTRFARCCQKDQSFAQSCETSWFGCCPDGKSPAQGPDQLGCPIMCGCNKLGAYSEACDPATNACKCRPGVGGEKCDRCEPGYWGLPKISSGHHGCIPCGCSTFGSVRDDCEQMTGRCVCKPGVQGQKCTECASTTKILTSSGCISADLAKQPVTSCKDLTCHFGAVCLERNHFVYCECPAEFQCQNDDSSDVVCGSDGQTYPNACTLRKVACKLQRDIVVQTFGKCKSDQTSNSNSNPNANIYGSGTDWPVKHYTPLQFTQSDDSNSPLSKSTRHLLHIQKYQNPKYDNFNSHTKQAFRPTPATVRVFTALLGDLCSDTQDCPILYSHCIRGACTCLPEYSESPDRQECITIDTPDITEIIQGPENLPRKYETPSFNGQSYIRLKPLKAYHKLNIELEFKTYGLDGVLFYNQQLPVYKRSQSDFVSLAIRNGYVEFRYNLGDGPVVITSLEKVTLGEFHRVVAKRYHKDGMLQVDDGENVAGQSEGKLRALDLSEDGYLGGVSVDYKQIYENVGVTHGLQGCIRKLKLGRKAVDLHEGYDDLVIHSENIGECTNKNFLQNADLKVQNNKIFEEDNLLIPEFDGAAFLKYPSLQNLPGLRINGIGFFKIEIVFLSKVKNGLIFYNGQLTNGRGDFISLTLVKGHLQFRFNLGSGIANITSKEIIKLNYWHSVKITRDNRVGTLQLDQGQVYKGHSGMLLTELNLGMPFYIGSLQNWSEIHRLSGVATGFKGAIQKIQLNDIILNMNLTDCISSTNLKIEYSNTQESLASLKTKGCQYKIGAYNGPPCPPHGHPCQNGGRCKSRLNNYVCHCPNGYEGQNCDISNIGGIRFRGDMFLTYNDPSLYNHNLSHELSSLGNNLKQLQSQKAAFIDTEMRREVNQPQPSENDDDAENENDAEFYDASGAEITSGSKSKRGSRYEFRLRTATPDGLLLWRADDEDYFSIALVAGYPELSFNLDNRKASYTIKSETRIDDQMWHTLRVRRKQGTGSIQVDENPPKEEFFEGRNRNIKENSIFFLGGAPAFPTYYQLPNEYYQNFKGCIDYLKINSQEINLLQPVENSENDAKRIEIDSCHQNP